ncbi:MAG TPA: hypothetical protein VF821_06895 [Lentzea sp.]
MKVWMPKASKPTANYRFKTVEQREAWVAQFVESVEVSQAAKAEARAAAKNKARECASSVEVGTVFAHSWGYDQTNVDFYQVVAKRGQMVEVRPIASTEIDGTAMAMSGHVTPVPGAFITKSYKLQDAHGNYKQSLTKRLQFTDSGAPYLSFEYGWCGVWEGKPMYSSWYA